MYLSREVQMNIFFCGLMTAFPAWWEMFNIIITFQTMPECFVDTLLRNSRSSELWIIDSERRNRLPRHNTAAMQNVKRTNERRIAINIFQMVDAPRWQGYCGTEQHVNTSHLPDYTVSRRFIDNQERSKSQRDLTSIGSEKDTDMVGANFIVKRNKTHERLYRCFCITTTFPNINRWVENGIHCDSPSAVF